MTLREVLDRLIGLIAAASTSLVDLEAVLSASNASKAQMVQTLRDTANTLEATIT